MNQERSEPLKRFYITTPIYYVNDVPHIGHAYTTIAADVLARYKRLCGYQVFFLTGSDEHGQKVERTAKEGGETPKELADRVVERFKGLWKRLNISNDGFIRTTDTRHKEGVRKFFKTVYDKGDIYLGEYEDWYCTPCETFWTKTQLRDGKCPDCGRPTEKLKEKSYFFRMSKYQERLLEHIKNNPDFIQPPSRRNEVISFIKGGLRDLSVSRTTFDWGIRLPIDPDHVIYVWFDALINYITGIGYGDDEECFKRFWPADIHIIGKDILRFHAVYWPTFLMSADLPLPKKVFGHGWWTVDGKKMSKSLQNVVEPNILIDEYGTDALRYFLLREIPFGIDGDFSHKAMIGRINSDLANDIGNLLSRSVTMVKKYFNGIVPTPSEKGDFDEDLIKMSIRVITEIDPLIDKLAFNKVLISIWDIVRGANKYIDDTAPWTYAKKEDGRKRLSTIIYNILESLRIVTLLIYPFMPETAEELWRQLGIEEELSSHNINKVKEWGKLKPGTQIRPGRHLFPRIDEERINKIMDTVIDKETKKEEAPSLISIEEFAKLDMRVGEIREADKVEGSKKLLKLRVDIGTEERIVVAGIAADYKPEGLIGKKVIVVVNLKPAKLMGIESQGMVLAANGEKGIILAEFSDDVGRGTKVK